MKNKLNKYQEALKEVRRRPKIYDFTSKNVNDKSLNTLQELVSVCEKLETKDKLYEEFSERVGDILQDDEYGDNADILNGIFDLFNNLSYRIGEME